MLKAAIGFGMRITTARRAADLNQDQVAARSRLPRSSLSRWENELATPSRGKWSILAAALECDAKWLQWGNMKPPTKAVAPQIRSPATAGFGARITAAREAIGIDQATFAARCGVAQGTVSRWESEGARPHRERWPAIAEALQANVKILRWGSLEIPPEGHYRGKWTSADCASAENVCEISEAEALRIARLRRVK